MVQLLELPFGLQLALHLSISKRAGKQYADSARARALLTLAHSRSLPNKGVLYSMMDSPAKYP